MQAQSGSGQSDWHPACHRASTRGAVQPDGSVSGRVRGTPQRDREEGDAALGQDVRRGQLQGAGPWGEDQEEELSERQRLGGVWVLSHPHSFNQPI